MVVLCGEESGQEAYKGSFYAAGLKIMWQLDDETIADGVESLQVQMLGCWKPTSVPLLFLASNR
jgi:hypothetical protein